MPKTSRPVLGIGPLLFEDDEFDDDVRRQLFEQAGRPIPEPAAGRGLMPRWATWARMPTWTRDEALALAFAPALLQIASERARKLKLMRAADLRARVPPTVFDDLVRLHVGLPRDMFDRAIAAGQITDPAPPADWLALARRLSLSVHPDLDLAVREATSPVELEAAAPKDQARASKPEPARQQGRPGHIKAAVMAWLDKLLHEHGREYMERLSDHQLAESWVNEDRAGASDYVRRVIAEWRRGRGAGPKQD